MGYLREETMRLIKKYGIRPKKKYSQSFLICDTVARDLVNFLNLKETDTVLEIGAGLGLLTGMIAEKCAKVIAVEIDSLLVDIMKKETLSKYDNIEIIEGDILEIRIPKVNKVFSNVPYHISSPLLFKLAQDAKFEFAILVFQKEFAYRLIANPGSKSYGRLSIATQAFFDIELLKLIPKYCFYPVPEVDSMAVKLVPSRKIPENKSEDFLNLIRKIFPYRNKLVSKALKIAYGNRDYFLFEKNIPRNLLSKRVRELTISDVLILLDTIS
ncbi:MAG: ribosomal RNA small subunit methyltransferase A [Thermoprotei archaeon]|nr:MAG: ribosomal RNA small subunit methyltransferase A [Thermoprotei archaeon]